MRLEAILKFKKFYFFPSVICFVLNFGKVVLTIALRVYQSATQCTYLYLHGLHAFVGIRHFIKLFLDLTLTLQLQWAKIVQTQGFFYFFLVHSETLKLKKNSKNVDFTYTYLMLLP